MTSRSTTPALHNRLAAFASTSSTQSEATTHVSSAISSAYSPAPFLTHEPAALAAHSISGTRTTINKRPNVDPYLCF
ncbi:hypothetical protein OG21DRAFT_1506726 [Imleria badia]|nr:hypothetical protein OG21DRAFT_1506726 [Imleria badia]